MHSKEFPPKPPPMIDKSGKFEIVPHVQTFKVRELDPDPNNKIHIDLTNKYGPMIRITYSRGTYDLAIDEAKRLLETGHPRERIQFVRADRDLVDALSGKWSLKKLEEVKVCK